MGVRYTPTSGDLGPLITWRAIGEGPARPAVTLGVSADRLGSEEQTYFVALAKDLEPVLGLPIAPYAGIIWGDGDRRFRFPMGASIRVGRQWTLLPTFDGEDYHPMVRYQWGRLGITGIMQRMRDPGLALSTGF